MITTNNPVDLDISTDLYFMQHRIRYQGRCMTVAEWAIHLGLTQNGMRNRYRQFGITPEMFATSGSKCAWVENKKGNGCIKRYGNPDSLSRKSIFRLVTYLINDAKQEMLVNDLGAFRFNDAQKFLKDVDGNLTWWLECLDIDVIGARTALREYATSGYKKERNRRNLKRSV